MRSSLRGGGGGSAMSASLVRLHTRRATRLMSGPSKDVIFGGPTWLGGPYLYAAANARPDCLV